MNSELVGIIAVAVFRDGHTQTTSVNVQNGEYASKMRLAGTDNWVVVRHLTKEEHDG